MEPGEMFDLNDENTLICGDENDYWVTEPHEDENCTDIAEEYAKIEAECIRLNDIYNSCRYSALAPVEKVNLVWDSLLYLRKRQESLGKLLMVELDGDNVLTRVDDGRQSIKIVVTKRERLIERTPTSGPSRYTNISTVATFGPWSMKEGEDPLKSLEEFIDNEVA